MFLHWLVGMVYVFYFASFVLLLREVLRPGVLWFLRNLNDPDFHPVQEVRAFFKLCPRIDYQPLFAKWSHVSPAEDFREDRKPKPRKRRISSLVMVDPLSKLFKKLSPLICFLTGMLCFSQIKDCCLFEISDDTTPCVQTCKKVFAVIGMLCYTDKFPYIIKQKNIFSPTPLLDISEIA